MSEDALGYLEKKKCNTYSQKIINVCDSLIKQFKEHKKKCLKNIKRTPLVFSSPQKKKPSRFFRKKPVVMRPIKINWNGTFKPSNGNHGN